MRITDQIGQSAIDRHISGESTASIARALGINFYSLWSYFDRRGMKSHDPHSVRVKFPFNQQYFSLIDHQDKAYWLGFIAADGGIQHNAVRIQLSVKDRDHLQVFLNCVGSEQPIMESTPSCPYSGVQLNSATMAADLARYGVTPRKTFTLRWPEIPEPMYPHFLRGYMDGDGGFYCAHNPKYGYAMLSFQVTSNVEFCLGIQNYLRSVCDLPEQKLNVSRNPLIGAVRYGGRKQVERIYDLVYRDANIYLARKRDKVESYVHTKPTENTASLRPPKPLMPCTCHTLTSKHTYPCPIYKRNWRAKKKAKVQAA